MLDKKKTAIAPEDRVPLGQKLAYGAGGMVENLAGNITKQMFNPVFNIGLGISPATISIVLMVYRLWDAFADLGTGNLSDNTRTRWGRRRPYIIVGGILTGIFLPVLWRASPSWSHGWIVAYMILAGMLLYTAFAIWGMPYYSLGMEMTPDYNERTRILAFRAAFGQVTNIAGGWLLALTSLPVFINPQTGKVDVVQGMQMMSWVMGAVIIVLAVLPGFFVKERYYQKEARTQRKSKLLESLRETLKCRPFLYLMAVYVLQTVGSSMVSSLGLYINIYYINDGDIQKAAVIQGLKSTAGFLPGLIGIPIWTWISERFGKTKALGLTVAMGFVSNILVYFCYTPAYPYLQILPQIFLSAFGAAIWMLIPSMQADVADYDELHTAERREGSFSSVSSWIFKVSMTMTTGLSGFLIVWSGFDIAKYGSHQPEAVLRNMLHWYVFLPFGLWIMALIALRFYPLDPQRMAAIRSELEQRRGRV